MLTVTDFKRLSSDYNNTCQIYVSSRLQILSGHFAVVRRAVHKKSGEAFAAKFIRKRRGGGRKGAKAEDIQREVSILKQLDHENVIRLYDVYETGIEVILILEL
ncbi:death-associated protein kinase 1 [Elysia marginata]|uniref:Death-associated protein kinase 1 n=1 Tax=Elysia marginata TaxID=1093978 RepID=A0AAV4F3C1_9GAST|nr:death-associated protein kinase 1 [Elysia marginata]